MLKPLRGGRPGKADLHVVLVDVFERGDVIDLDQPSLANDRHAVAGVFDFGQDVRGEKDSTSLCAHFSHHFIEFLLVERIQPAGWLVEDEDARLVHESLNQPDLAFVAARILTKLACGVEIEPLNELLEVCLVDTAAQVAQVFENLTAAQARIKGELAGQIADQFLDFGRLRPAIQAANGGAAAVGAQQAHQRAHGGGFACAVGSQEAENLALLNVEGYVDDAPVPAITFREPVGLNNSSHIFSLLPVRLARQWITTRMPTALAFQCRQSQGNLHEAPVRAQTHRYRRRRCALFAAYHRALRQTRGAACQLLPRRHTP